MWCIMLCRRRFYKFQNFVIVLFSIQGRGYDDIDFYIISKGSSRVHFLFRVVNANDKCMLSNLKLV